MEPTPAAMEPTIFKVHSFVTTEEHAALKAANEALRAALTIKGQRLDELADEYTVQYGELNSIKAEHDDELSEQEDIIEFLTSENERLEDELDEYALKLEESARDLQTKDQAIACLAAKNSQLEDELDEYALKLAQSEHDLQSEDADDDFADADGVDLEDELAHAEEENEILTLRLAEMTESRDKWEKEARASWQQEAAALKARSSKRKADEELLEPQTTRKAARVSCTTMR